MEKQAKDVVKPNNQEESKLIIYQRYLELIYYTNDIVRKYPKSETFALVKEIKSNVYAGLRLLLYAIKTYRPQEKVKYLNEFDISINLLKVHVRLSYRYKYITMKNYEVWSNIITDVCNMLGGWINACLKK